MNHTAGSCQENASKQVAIYTAFLIQQHVCFAYALACTTKTPVSAGRPQSSVPIAAGDWSIEACARNCMCAPDSRPVPHCRGHVRKQPAVQRFFLLTQGQRSGRMQDRWRGGGSFKKKVGAPRATPLAGVRSRAAGTSEMRHVG